MSLLCTCPKCHHESLDSNSFRVWCLYATSCGYSIPADSAVDAGQTHSYEPTTKTERDKRSEFLNSPALQHNPLPHVEWELRLIADVNQTESRMQSLKDDAGDMLCDLEDQVKRLEENARFMRDDYSPVGARGCRLCVYEDGVLQRSCRLHQEIARLQDERQRWLNHRCVFQ